jgi:hypothetical protein
MNQTPPEPPEFEPGGNRVMVIVAVIVVTALGGIVWTSFPSRDKPAAGGRNFPPPTARPDTGQPPSDPSAPAPVPTAPAPR